MIVYILFRCVNSCQVLNSFVGVKSSIYCMYIWFGFKIHLAYSSSTTMYNDLTVVGEQSIA